MSDIWFVFNNPLILLQCSHYILFKSCAIRELLKSKDEVCFHTLMFLCMRLFFPQACKYAMRVCAPVVGSEQISTMFLNHLHEEKGLHYGEFINDLTKYLVWQEPKLYNKCTVHLDLLCMWKIIISSILCCCYIRISFIKQMFK